MKFKKLRKIYRILFPLKLSEKKIFENNLESNNLIKGFQNYDDVYLLKLINGKQIYLRGSGHSDYSVFNQIFREEEYKTVSSIVKFNKELWPRDSKDSVMIDAGANIGYAALYLQQLLNFNKVFCIEPSKSNFEMLKKNTAILDENQNLTLLQKALAATENLNFDIENDFRDGKDWSITTKESKTGKVQGITINEIINSNDLKEITLLKIDIEGAERFIFNKKSDLSFLNKTKLIVIEIHDEFNIREEIYQILQQNNFLLIESGELTIGLNKSFCHINNIN